MLSRRRQLRRYQAEHQLGSIIAAIHNNGMKSYREPPKAADFMFTSLPDRPLERSGSPRRRMTEKRRQDIANALRAFAGIKVIQ